MSNQMTPFADQGTELTSLSDMGSALLDVGSMNSGLSGVPFLKMDKNTGVWTHGQEQIEVEEGSLWAINPTTVKKGFISWGDARNVLGEEMVPAGQAMPDQNALKNTGFKWDPQLQLDMTCVSGADEGLTVRYKSTALGGKRAVSLIAGLIGKRAAAENAHIVPVVQLTQESYDHRSYGVIYNPIWDINYWMDMEGNEEEGQEAAPRNAPAAAPKSNKRSRRAA